MRPFVLSGHYISDVLYVDASKDTSFLDNLSLQAELALDRATGLEGLAFVARFQSNSGASPSDAAPTLSGIDNIEVVRQAGRLFELFLERRTDTGAWRVGYFDLNADFYSTSASSLLINPSFGIGSEIAATGENGPSIFPSSALGGFARRQGADGHYLQAAVFDAVAGVPGDPGGFSLGFKQGALLIAEAGIDSESKLSLGAWTYTDEQADVLGAGAEDAGGVYLLAQGRLGSDGPTAFARIGVSDGKTSPFSGGLQVGLALERLFPSRPESALALGLHAARLGGAFRESLRADSVNPAHYEWGLELTYSDAIARGVTLQPTLQAISNPGGDTDAGTLWVAGVRFTASFNED